MIQQTSSQVIGSDSDLFFELKGSYTHTTFPHCHDYYEFCFIVSGKQELEINNHNFEVGKGALIFMRPKDLHSKKYIQAGEHMTIAFPSYIFNSLFSYLGEGFTADLLTAPNFSPIVHLSDIEIESIVNQFKRMFLAKIYDPKVVKIQYKIILIQMFSKYFTELRLGSKTRMPRWFEEVILKMQEEENFTEGINAMIRISGTCHEHLCRLMNKYLHMTPTQWVNDQRLNYAVTMLQYSNKNISSICFDSGFGNISHFYHEFKKKFGISPAKFRKEKSFYSIL